MLKAVRCVGILVILTAVTQALDNGLARTPPMGWLTWTRFGCNTDCANDKDFCISERLIMQMADRMAEDGYRDAGYEYVCLDDCWLASKRDSNNTLQPDPVRFPSGMKFLSDYVHSKGLKLGIYSDFGTSTCAGYPGSEFFLQKDAQTFAEWGIDLLKFDTCHSDAHDNKIGYPAMSRYLNQTGRKILFSCEWPYGELQQHLPSDYGPVRQYCNIWRNFWDISDSFDSVKGIITEYSKNNSLYQKFTGPGGFFDPDMLLVGGFGLSDYQQKTHMAMWSLWSAPLIMSNDLRAVPDLARKLLLNKVMISINQDPMGMMASLLWEFQGLQVWVKPIMPKGSMAVALVNLGSFGSGVRYNSTADTVGLTDPRGYIITDVFTQTDLGVYLPSTPVATRVLPFDTYMLRCIIRAK